VVEQFEAEPKSPKAAPEHQSWAETVSDIYHSAMRSVGFEKEEPKYLEFKKLDLSEFKHLKPTGESFRVLNHGESIHRFNNPCISEFLSKALVDPNKIDTSCLDKEIAAMKENK